MPEPPNAGNHPRGAPPPIEDWRPGNAQARRVSINRPVQRVAGYTPAPRQFVESTSIIDLFDLSFQRYLTPWIVKITWVIALLLALFQIVILSFSFIADAAPSSAIARDPASAREFESLPAHTTVDYTSAIRLAWRITRVVSIVLAVLWIRVLLECVIVVFNIAKSVTSVESLQRRIAATTEGSSTLLPSSSDRR